ncbi:hypothetical protein ZTR_09864 [Talaromyces verruculosus]|nr:hypothetical protein ZTR_09864 [Talaromyces verruculosus]
MKISPETMADVATDLLGRNNWGIREQGSFLIELTSPVVANRAIIAGVVGGSKSTTPYASAARDGQNHAENAKCRGISSHTVPPTSNAATVRIGTRHGSALRHGGRRYQLNVPTAAADIAQSAESAQQHHRPEKTLSKGTTWAQEAEPSQPPPPTIIDLELEPVGTERDPQVRSVSTKPRRCSGRPKGSRTRPKEQAPPSTIISESQWSTRSQPVSRRVEEDNTVSKRRPVGEPEDTMDEQPDGNNWFDDKFEDELTQFTNDITTIDDIDTTPEPAWRT